MSRKLTDTALPESLPAWGVLVLESHHSPEFSMNWRTHAFLKVVYVLRGRGEFQFDNQVTSSHLFSPGDVVIVPPGTPNRIVDDPASASSLYVCCVSTSRLSFDPTIVRQLKTRCVRGQHHYANRAASLMRRMVHWQQRESNDRPIQMVLDALRLVELVKQNPVQTDRQPANAEPSRQRALMERYVASLPSEFFEATSIDAAASELGIPRRTFTKLFVEISGETWLQCVRRLAIQHATTRLRETDLPIASVAFECGFNELSTFYRQFKNQIGKSPAAYRDEMS